MKSLLGTSIDQARQALKDEETRISQALTSVRIKLNQVLPISWLPTEILEEIFGICVSWLYGFQKPKYRLAWTQVCTSWRRISFNSTRLWRRIDLCETRFAREFLARSKTAPLSIISASPPRLCTNDLPIHAEQLEVIDIFLFLEDMVELFSRIGANFTTLTTLSLKIPSVSSNLYLDVSLPRIRRLSLDCVAVPWDQYFNLTHLNLRSLMPEYSPTISQLHAIFRNSPYLEYVRLEGTAPAPGGDLTQDHLIPLTHLREMTITSNALVIAAILAGVSLGSSARLQLYSSLVNDLRTLFPHGLPYHQNAQAIPSVSHIRLSRHSAYFMRQGGRPWAEEPSMTAFSISSASSVHMPVLSSLYSLLDLSRVTTLEFGTGVLIDTPTEALEGFLARTENLHTLRIAFNDLKGLFHILSKPRSGRKTLICPCLTRISFNRPTDLWYHFNENWLQQVLTCASERQACSFPLQTLEFVKCHGVTAAIAEQMKDVVREVVVLEHIGTQRR